MSIGMSYDEFWNQNVSMVKAYRKAYELREKRRNQELWLQGMYVYEALCDASPLFRFTMKKGAIKPEPYPKEPYPITVAEVREREEREGEGACREEWRELDRAREGEPLQGDNATVGRGKQG